VTLGTLHKQDTATNYELQELFQNVTHELVTIAGVAEAWRLREVCRTFAAEIKHDVFSKQSRKAFATVDGTPPAA
jgi:hypothetical protein